MHLLILGKLPPRAPVGVLQMVALLNLRPTKRTLLYNDRLQWSSLNVGISSTIDHRMAEIRLSMTTS
jgi:hypothetical protein